MAKHIRLNAGSTAPAIGIGVGAFVLIQALFWLWPHVFTAWHAQTTDRFFSLRALYASEQAVYDSTIITVDISRRTTDRLGRYLDRSHYARVVHNLSAMGVAAQMYDFVIADRFYDASADSALIAETAEARQVYYGLFFETFGIAPSVLSRTPEDLRRQYLDRTRWAIVVESEPPYLYGGSQSLPTFPALAEASRGLGHQNLMPDADGVFRRMPLLVRYGNGYYPSLPLRVICDYLGVPPEQVVLAGDRLTLKQAGSPGNTVKRDIVIPLDANGAMVVNFVGPWSHMRHYDFADVYGLSDDRIVMRLIGERDFKDRIVVVGSVESGRLDRGTVPTDVNYPLSGLLANVMHTILTESFLRDVTYTETAIIEVAMLALLIILSGRFSSIRFAVSAAGLLAGYTVIAGLLFMYGGLILNLIQPALIVVCSTGGLLILGYIREERERAALRQSFEAYFAPAIVDKVMAHPDRLASAGARKVLSIMFTDIVGFTPYSATQEPGHIQNLLNEYFGLMIDIAFSHGGTIEKFMGDGLMIFFGDPEPQSDHALRAVRTAIDMQRATRRLKDTWSARGDMPIRIRVGINTGPVIVGNMGSARRLTYTVIGADANLAQRMESNAPPGGILITKATYDLIKEEIEANPQGNIQVKGLEEPVEVYDVPVNQGEVR